MVNIKSTFGRLKLKQDMNKFSYGFKRPKSKRKRHMNAKNDSNQIMNIDYSSNLSPSSQANGKINFYPSNTDYGQLKESNLAHSKSVNTNEIMK